LLNGLVGTRIKMSKKNSVTELKLASRLLGLLAERNVEVVVWKNVNELPEALTGHGDVDLYIKRESRAGFMQCLRDLGFVEVRSPNHFPSVSHFYGFDTDTSKFMHLHCYFRIVTGESHLKQYVLPLESYLKNVNCSTDGNRFPELDAEIQYKLHCLRRQIKLSCLPGLYLFIRERKGYKLERTLLRNRVQNKPANKIAGWLSEVKEYDSTLTEFFAGIVLRRKLQAFNRFNAFESFAFRYGIIAKRFINKLRRRKKRVPEGMIIAIVGLDGSGKSTAVEMASKWLAKHFDVKTIHYGLGSPCLLTLPLQVILTIRRSLPGTRKNYSEIDWSLTTGGAPVGWLPHLRYLGLAWERNRLLKRANRLTSRGVIVVSDRWRSIDTGKMDSPRLDPTKSTGLRRHIALLEQRLYDCSPDANLIINIRVDVQTAIERNRLRDKPGKETDEGISKRFKLNGDLAYHADTVVRLDGTSNMAEVHANIRKLIWDTVVLGSEGKRSDDLLSNGLD